ncbi:MAG TPA: flagellar hook-basal body complex protein FliE [Steroidobacteraceae bacterium]|nr:flagellar hook-basal body complex protein FliE [Steroidobacteraceae bacterium]
MSIEAISALTATSAATGTTPVAPLEQAQATHSAVFDSLVSSMHDLSAQMQSNAQAVESLATGDMTQLHRVVMNLESTKLQFDLALQVRNKILDAYQELIRMQV